MTLIALAFWLVRRKRHGKPTLLDPDLFKHQLTPAILSGSPGRRKGTRVSVENADAAPAAEGAGMMRAGRTRGPAFPSLCADAFMAAPQRRPGS